MTLGLIDELADEATRLVQDGVYSSPEDAVDAIVSSYCTNGTCEPGMAGWGQDIWNLLTGKPDSWYKNISRIQNRLSILLAGVTAVGSDAWGVAVELASVPIDDYDTVTSRIQSAIKSIIVTDNHVPEDSTISAADSLAASYEAQLSTVSSVSAEEVQRQIQADQQLVSSELPGPMSSPAKVGQAEFVDQVEKRAAALGAGIMDWTKYVTWGIGGLAAIYLLSKLGGGR